MRRSASLVAALACAAALLAGCSDSPAAAPAATADTSTRDLQIYATVIRELVTVDHTFGSGPSPFKHVWVVDAPMSGVGRPGAGESRGQAFSETFKADLSREMTDIGPLDFVADGDEVRQMDSDPQVRDRGVIVTVGPIEKHGDKVHVGHEIWCGGTCAEWFTYVLEERDGRWVITDDTGERAIA